MFKNLILMKSCTWVLPFKEVLSGMKSSWQEMFFFMIQFFVFLQFTVSLVVLCTHPMILTWFGVLHTFIGVHVWLSLELCCMLLIEVSYGCMPSIAFWLAWKGPPQCKMVHKSPLCGIWVESTLGFLATKNCLGLLCGLCSLQKVLAPTAVDSS